MTLEHQQKLRKQARMAFKGSAYEESIAYYQQLIAEGGEQDAPVPQQAQDRAELGTAYMRVSRFAEAEREFESVILLDPQNAPAQHKLGLANIRLGHPQRALEALRRATQLAPQEAVYHWALAELALAVGSRDEAQAALDASLALDPENAEAQAAKRALAAQTPDAFGGLSGKPIADDDFASLVEFIKARPAEDAAPIRAVDQTYKPLVYVCLGSVAFLAIYLYVRFIMIG